MNKVKKNIDINAHIENIQSKVNVEDNGTVAIISFDNLGFGVITAVKFNARGFNSFGDVINIGNNENFLIVIQDICINKNSHSQDIKVKLPNADIRRLEIEESQICYADGTVSTYNDKNDIEFELEELTSENELLALKDVFDSRVKYNLCESEYGWICTCGRYNNTKENICSLCKHSKSEIITHLSEDGRKKAIEKKKELDFQRKAQEEKQVKEKEIADRNKKIVITIAVVVGIIFFSLICNSVKMSKREVYSSKEEMQEAMQGKWTHYSNDYGFGRDAMWQWIIEEDKAYQIFNSDDEKDYEYDITWNPSKGTFKIGSHTMVVQKGGREFIEGKDELYEKGGYLSSSDSSSYTSSYESAYSALQISNVSVSNNSSYAVCTGTITNKGKKTYSFVQVKGAFKNSSGTVLDTDSTYAVGSEGLAPGESKTFRMSVAKNYQITSCSVSIYDYN